MFVRCNRHTHARALLRQSLFKATGQRVPARFTRSIAGCAAHPPAARITGRRQATSDRPLLRSPGGCELAQQRIASTNQQPISMGTGEVEGTARRMGGGAELENAGENGPKTESKLPYLWGLGGRDHRRVCRGGSRRARLDLGHQRGDPCLQAGFGGGGGGGHVIRSQAPISIQPASNNMGTTCTYSPPHGVWGGIELKTAREMAIARCRRCRTSNYTHTTTHHTPATPPLKCSIYDE